MGWTSVGCRDVVSAKADDIAEVLDCPKSDVLQEAIEAMYSDVVESSGEAYVMSDNPEGETIKEPEAETSSEFSL